MFWTNLKNPTSKCMKLLNLSRKKKLVVMFLGVWMKYGQGENPFFPSTKTFQIQKSYLEFFNYLKAVYLFVKSAFESAASDAALKYKQVLKKVPMDCI